MPASSSLGTMVSSITSRSRVAPKWPRCTFSSACSSGSGKVAILPNSFQLLARRRMPMRSWCTCSGRPTETTPRVSISARGPALKQICSRHSSVVVISAWVAFWFLLMGYGRALRGAQKRSISLFRYIPEEAAFCACLMLLAAVARASPRCDLLRKSSCSLYFSSQRKPTSKIASGEPLISSNSTSDTGSSRSPARITPRS